MLHSLLVKKLKKKNQNFLLQKFKFEIKSSPNLLTMTMSTQCRNYEHIGTKMKNQKTIRRKVKKRIGEGTRGEIKKSRG